MLRCAHRRCQRMLKQTVLARRYFALSGTWDDRRHAQHDMTPITPGTPKFATEPFRRLTRGLETLSAANGYMTWGFPSRVFHKKVIGGWGLGLYLVYLFVCP